MKTFNIEKILGYNIDLEIRVYSSIKSMQRGIIRNGNIFEIGTKSQFCPIHVIGGETEKFKAILFLCKNFLTMRIITHESTHIALWVCRQHKLNLNFGDEIDQTEEDFAYILGEVGRLLVLNLTALEYYK